MNKPESPLKLYCSLNPTMSRVCFIQPISISSKVFLKDLKFCGCIFDRSLHRTKLCKAAYFALKVSKFKTTSNAKQMTLRCGMLLEMVTFEMGIFNEAVKMYKSSLEVDGKQHDIRLKLSCHCKNFKLTVPYMNSKNFRT